MYIYIYISDPTYHTNNCVLFLRFIWERFHYCHPELWVNVHMCFLTFLEIGILFYIFMVLTKAFSKSYIKKITFITVSHSRLMEMEHEVIQAMRNKEDLVRKWAEKKMCDSEVDKVKEILTTLDDNARRLTEESRGDEKVRKRCEGKNRVLKWKLKSHIAAETIKGRGGTINGTGKYKETNIRETVTIEERLKRREFE